MSCKYTIADGVRMMGHLLEHHPTEGVLARTKTGRPIGPSEENASCWCFFGAVNAVSESLGIDTRALTLRASLVCDIENGQTWDRHNNKKSLCKKLQEYKG